MAKSSEPLIVPDAPPEMLPGGYNVSRINIWQDNLKPEGCRACPHLPKLCNLRGHKAPIAELGYNLVFLLDSPDFHATVKNQDVAPNTFRVLDQICAPINKAMRTGKQLGYSVVYASGYPSGKTPTAKEINACRANVRAKLAELASANVGLFGPYARPNVVVAFGSGAWASLEFKGKESELLGREHVIQVGHGVSGHYHVIPSHSFAKIRAMGGFIEPATAHVRRGVRILFDHFTPIDIRAATAKMPFPHTEEELRAVVDQILAYTGKDGVDAAQWPIAVDFETTGLDMWDPKERIISAAVAWDRHAERGTASAWLLNHKEVKDPAVREGMWRQTVRLLESGKPIIMHNGMFDFGCLIGRGVDVSKVNFWDDTMCREHHLRENARGSYGLKFLTSIYCPDFSGYETQLHHQMQKDVQAQMSKADTWVDYVTAEDRKLDTQLVPDLPALEKQYVQAALAQKVTLKADANYPALARTVSSLWSRIRNRYKDKLKVDPPERAVVTLSDLFSGSGAFECVPTSVLLPYNAMDVVATMCVFEGQTQALFEQDELYTDARANGITVVPAHVRPGHPQWVKGAVPVNRVTWTDARSVARRLYVPMSRAYAHMKHVGLVIDQKKLAAYEEQSAKLEAHYLGRLCRVVGRAINPNATREVIDALLGPLGVPDSMLPRTPKGSISTGSTTMELIIDKMATSPAGLFAHLLLTWRAMRDTRSRYLAKIRAGIVKDGKLHPGFHITSTKTGRSSVSNPSMQNWPKLMGRSAFEIRASQVIRDGLRLAAGAAITVHDQGDVVLPVDSFVLCVGPETYMWPVEDVERAAKAGLKVTADKVDGFALKSLIIPPPGMAYFNLDIASAEVRLACAYFDAGDALTEAILQGRNIPSYVCAKAMGAKIAAAYSLDPNDIEAIYNFVQAKKDSDPIIGEWRTGAKRALYGAFYGAGIETLALQIFGSLSDDMEERQAQLDFAQEIYDGLMSEFPSIQSFIKSTHKHVGLYKRARSLFGRYRRFPMADLSARDKGDMRRESVNFLIQSSANDVTFLAAAKMEQRCRELGGHVTLTVHDAISGWWPVDRLEELGSLVQECVTDYIKNLLAWLPVPWEYDLEVGTSYGDMAPLAAMLGGKLTIKKHGAKALKIARALGYPQPEDAELG